MITTRPYDNPFTPSFGEVPSFMAGRSEIISNLVRAFDSSRRSPYLSCAITGARGTGKTALLSFAGREAEARGWICVDASALPGLLEDIYERALDAASHLLDSSDSPRITSVSMAGAGVSWEYPASEGGNWRTRMSRLLEELAEFRTGLLITVDEVRPDLDELVQLVTAYQHFVRENRRVALLLAGLPRNMSALIRDESASFLRRAQSVTLGLLPSFEARLAFERTCALAGKEVDDDALDVAVEAAGGFPFMVQLVGFRMWEAAVDDESISAAAALEGARLARLEFTERILGPTYRELSPGDRAFLRAMLDDDDVSALGDVAHRLERGNSYAAQYKRRLLDQGVIEEDFDGMLRFAMPGMREFVEERPAKGTL